MKRICVIGDIHTVTAFRLGGIHGVISSTETIREDLMNPVGEDESAIVIITRDLSGEVRDIIEPAGPEPGSPAIVEIPGITGEPGSAASILAHVTAALGISI
jgi:vacuolar-type H+-ATPase subunit F/Vma7